MSRVALFTILAAATIATAQSSAAPNPTGTEPLIDKIFASPTDLPYKVDPNNGLRGTQSGYNICNSTTEGPDSLCQTGYMNHIDDWCVWAPPTGPTTIGDSEAIEVAWCTKSTYGTRVIPAGVITGVQFLNAKSYIEAIVFLDQTKLNMNGSDPGGELDPRGDDFRGNPIGGIVFSNNLPLSGTGNNGSYTQVTDWHNFIGSNISCFKACDPKDPNAYNYCYNRLDRVGIDYVCPNQAQDGVFEVCDSDNQQFPGVYTTNGVTTSYTQPPDSVPITTMPYTPQIPASSNCVTYQSSDLFAALPTLSSSSASGASASIPAPTSKGASSSSSPSRSGSGSTGSPTGSASKTGGAGALKTSTFATIAGVVFAVVFFA